MAYIRIYQNNALLDQFEITDKILTIGRDLDNDIVLDDPGVSSYHAQLETRYTKHVLTDLNSTNGTFVNRQRIAEQVLHFRDEIQVYSFVLRYMPRARLAQEEQLDIPDEQPDHTATVEMPILDANKLVELRERNKEAYLIRLENGQPTDHYKLSDIHFTLGRSRHANVYIGGWFGPRISATIIRQYDTYHLLPANRRKVNINGRPATQETTLKSGDHISVRNTEFLFQYDKANGN